MIRKALPDGISFEIPPGGIATGCGSLFLGSGSSLTAAILTAVAVHNQAPWGAQLFVAGVWLVGLAFLVHGISLARRTGTITLAGDRLDVTERGLFRQRRHAWQVEELAAVEVCASGVMDQVNNQLPRDIMELQITTKSGRGFRCFRYLPQRDLDGIAASVRRAIDARSTAGPTTGLKDPSAQPAVVPTLEFGYFPLTRFEDWRPGDLVRLRRRPFTGVEWTVGVVLVGILPSALSTWAIPFAYGFAVLLAGWGWHQLLGGVFAGPVDSGLPVYVLSFLMGPALAWLVLDSAMAPRAVALDWHKRLLTVRTRGRQESFPFSDVQGLRICSVVGCQQVGTSSGSSGEPQVRAEYLARLAVILPHQDLALLESDEWETTADRPLARLAPLAEELARALGVAIQVGPPIRDRWDVVGFMRNPLRVLKNAIHIWSEAGPAPKWAVGLLAVALLVLAGFQAYGGLIWAR